MQIPVGVTLLGLGAFPASHPLNLGMMGMHGESWLNEAIQQADLLIACGMRFDDRVIGTPSTYSPNSKKIHIEIDPAEINKNIKADVALIGDLREVLEQLLPLLPGRDGSQWLNTIESSKGTAAVRDIRNLPDNGHLYAAHVMHDLWRITEGKAIVCDRRRPAPDVGGAVLPPRLSPHADHLRRPRHHGLCAPRRHRRKIRLPRQGSLGHRRRRRLPDDRLELATIAQEKLNVNIAIINNGYLGMVRQWQEFFYDKNYESTPLVSPDFVKLADAHGIPGLAVRDPRRPRSRRPNRPHPQRRLPPQLHGRKRRQSVYPMIPAGKALHEMIRRPGHNPLLERPEDQ